MAETIYRGYYYYILLQFTTISTMETITIAKEEYEKLKKKTDIADDALVQLKLSFEDIRHKRVSKFDLKAS